VSGWIEDGSQPDFYRAIIRAMDFTYRPLRRTEGEPEHGIAEEMFLTSTSLCIAGVRTFNGAKIGDGLPPGPITKRLTDAYIAEVGCDFVKQYLDRLS
jgi:hypothetical protein